MRFYWNTEILIQLISTSVTLIMAVFLFYQLLKGKKKALVYYYTLCQILLFLWALSELLEAWTIDKPDKWLIIQLQFLPVCFIGVCWLLLCLDLTESKIVASRRQIYWLFIPSILLYGLLLTNEYHHLYFSVFEYDHEVFGTGFWANAVLAYSCILTGIILLFRYSLIKYHIAKTQFILMGLAALSPIIANILFVTKTINITYGVTPIAYDITPNAFSITVTLFTVAIIRYRFLNIWPLALREIAHNMKEAILVIDSYDKVVNYNRAFTDVFFKEKSSKRLEDLDDFSDVIKPRLADSTEAEAFFNILHHSGPLEINLELLLKNASQSQWFLVNIKPVLNNQGQIVGRIISLNDISNYKNLMNELSSKNKELQIVNGELLALNRQLEEYAATVEELTITAERNRFARDAHDTLGNTMALLIKMLEASLISCNNAPETAVQIKDAIKLAREGLSELRRSMFGLIPKRVESGSLKSALERLIADFRSSGLKVDFLMEGISDNYSPACTFVVYKICQEALTNSLRHGSAKDVTIILKMDDKVIRLVIIDDGCGCRKIKKGFGLSGMEQRVQSLNGRIAFYSDGKNGFSIKVEIPLVSV